MLVDVKAQQDRESVISKTATVQKLNCNMHTSRPIQLFLCKNVCLYRVRNNAHAWPNFCLILTTTRARWRNLTYQANLVFD